MRFPALTGILRPWLHVRFFRRSVHCTEYRLPHNGATWVFTVNLLCCKGNSWPVDRINNLNPRKAGFREGWNPHALVRIPPDTAAFLNPGVRNRHYLISPASGVSQSQFAFDVVQSGSRYGAPGGLEVPGYRILMGPNSNSAAAFPILDAGGAVPRVWNAPALNYWNPKP